MPEDHNNGNENNSPQNSIPDGDNRTIHIDAQNSGEEHIRTNQSRQNNTRRNKPQTVNIGKLPKIDIVESVETNRISKTANSISIASVIVNGLILAITASLAWVAVWQGKSSESSAKTAYKTYLADSANSQRIYIRDSLAKIKADTTDSIKNDREIALFNIQKEGLDAQIAAINKNQKNFELANEPYLQLTMAKMRRIMPMEPISIDYAFENLGNYPAKIISSKFGGAIIMVKKRIPTLDSLEKDKFKGLENGYLIKGIPASGPLENFIHDIPEVFYYDILTNVRYVYLLGEITYQNLINNKMRVYKFILRMRGNTDGQIEFIKNDNSDL